MRFASSAMHLPAYDWQDDVEYLEAYCPGGYHPIQLGDEFNGARYRVIHKLGYGRFSTVWLAKDCVNNRFVALKFITASRSKLNSEVQIRNRLRCGNMRHPGRSFVLSPLDEFYVDGPNGRHECLVNEVTGPAISEVKEGTKHELLPVEIAKKFTAQLAFGLAYVHSCGLVHGGLSSFPRSLSCKFNLVMDLNVDHFLLDLHSHNVTSHLPNMNLWTVDQLYENLGKPERCPISRCDGQPLGPEAPPYTVLPAQFWRLGKETMTTQIKIIDFGEASFLPHDRKELNTPLPFRAPESFFGGSLGPAADVWAFGCMVFNLFGQGQLFDAFVPSQDLILAEMVGALGTLPSQWWDRWGKRDLFFPSDGLPNTGDAPWHAEELKPLAMRIQEITLDREHGSEEKPGAFTPEELTNLQNLLTMVLRYIPSERATVEEILKLEWINQYVLGPKCDFNPSMPQC